MPAPKNVTKAGLMMKRIEERGNFQPQKYSSSDSDCLIERQKFCSTCQALQLTLQLYN